MNRYIKELENLKKKEQFRELRTIAKSGKFAVYKNKEYLNLSSNDYLGLSENTQILQEFYSVLNKTNISDFSFGSTSSRLLTGNSSAYDNLETAIAKKYNDRNALVFNSGYHANIGILPAIATKGDLILSDKLNHASIIDGMLLSKADFIRYKHRDYDDLTAILEKKRDKYKDIFIVSESVFSMDGDIADLNKLISIKKKFNAYLYIDEAHAVGVFGKNGLGICEEQDVIDDIDLIIGTFGKAFASIGAFCVTHKFFKDYLINKMRSFIFTTALSPVIINWNNYIFEKLQGFEHKRQKLKQITQKFRNEVNLYGLATKGSTHIVPIITKDNKKTIKIAEKLQSEGYLVFAIRPPTVPINQSRLRISLTTDMEWEDIRQIPKIIKELLQ